MPTYIVLADGYADIEQASEVLDGVDGDADTVERNKQIIDALGGELLDMYYTGGPYDAAFVVEFPDQDSLLDARHRALALGVDDLTVLDAVNYEDADALVAE